MHLNPIRIASQFVTARLLDDDATPPADVLFFAVDNDVATAVLVWHEPTGGRTFRSEQRISRLQFASSWHECPMTLQAAAVAAHAQDLGRVDRDRLERHVPRETVGRGRRREIGKVTHVR